jgi:thiamine biosynthesis lipoprotein
VIYHHILDPDTGYPVQDGIWGVSIICDSSLLGDELSTTCLAVGEEKAAEIIESMEGVEAIFVDDQLQVTTVGGG